MSRARKRTGRKKKGRLGKPSAAFGCSGVSWGGGGGGGMGGGGGGGLGGSGGGGFSTSNEVSPDNPLLASSIWRTAAPVSPPHEVRDPMPQRYARDQPQQPQPPPPPPVFVPKPPKPAAAGASIISDLRMLSDLLAAGHLSPAEFAEAKVHVLRGASAQTPDPVRGSSASRRGFSSTASAAQTPLPPSVAAPAQYDDVHGEEQYSIYDESSVPPPRVVRRRSSVQAAAAAAGRRRSVANGVAAGPNELAKYRYQKDQHRYADSRGNQVYEAPTGRVYDTHIRSAALDTPHMSAGSGALAIPHFDSRRASLGHDHWDGNVEVLSVSQAQRAAVSQKAPRRISDYEGAQAGAGVLAKFKWSSRRGCYFDHKTGQSYMPRFNVDEGTRQRYDPTTGEAR